MKKICLALLALAVTAVVNADIWMEVSDPYIDLSETTNISIWGDGQTPINQPFIMGFIYTDGASLNIDDAVIVYPGESTEVYMYNDPEIAEILGLANTSIIQVDFIDLYEPYEPLQGLLIDGIVFNPEDWGVSVVGLFDGNNGELLDTQTIYHIPEPMTIVLLGLGGLLLRRKK
jgi:hypothetical protein